VLGHTLSLFLHHRHFYRPINWSDQLRLKNNSKIRKPAHKSPYLSCSKKMVTFRIVKGRYQLNIVVGTSAILIEVFHGFLSFFLRMTRYSLHLKQDNLSDNSLKFTE
jgi:hypothetical protein